MATEIRTRHDVNRGAIEALIGTNTGTSRDMFRRGIRVQSAAKANVRKMGAIDTGLLLNSIGVDQRPGDRSGVLTTVGSDLDYALNVHDGRRPGARMPPVQAIDRWAARHGMAGAGFPIARAIARRGIKGRPFLKDALPAARG